MTREQMIRQNQIELESFMLHGGVITVLKAKKPRATERTFTAIKGSISNIGHQASALKLTGAKMKLRG